MTLTRKTLAPVATVMAVILCAFQIYATGGIGVLEAPVLRAGHLSMILFLAFFWIPPMKSRDPVWVVALDIMLALASMAVLGYILYDLEGILNHMRYVDEITPAAMAFGTLCMLLVLEATRRLSGWPLVIVAAAFIAYAMFGEYMPVSMRHDPITYDRFIETMFLLTDGIYGISLSTACTMIFAFCMFGAFLEVSTMNSVFMDLSCLLTRKSRGGPAKVAIFASALFGSISGSAPANVYATGVFTIPLMKRVGYRPAFSGAVEAVASTGGQIMPPVMGAAAFIMADLTGLGYLAVIKAALLPAVLYYLALWIMIHFEACKYNLGTIPPEDVPDKKSVIRRLYYLLPIGLLILLLLSGRSVNFAAFGTTLFIVFLGMCAAATRFTPARFLLALKVTARNALMVSTCCACAGIVVGCITATGIGFKFINIITSLADNNLVLMMIVLMLTCIVLGMGVPTTPAYIIVATLGAPVLIKMGVPVIAAHMFVFYYAILSVVTPPVCLAAFSGAAIAEADAMRTGFISMKLAVVAFIVPFFFVLQPSLLMQGSAMDVTQAIVTSIIAMYALAGAMQGYLLITANIIERAALLTGGLTMLYPGTLTDLVGLGCLIGVLALQLARRKFAHTATV